MVARRIKSRDSVWAMCSACRRNRAKEECLTCKQVFCLACWAKHDERNTFEPDPDDGIDTTMMPEDEV